MIVMLRKIAYLFQKRSIIIILYLVGLFLVTSVLMPILEGQDSPISNVFDNAWWFIVTITTVGYGDITPQSIGGKILAIIVMLSGIGFAAGLITYISTTIVDKQRKSQKGVNKLKVKDHIVILGYNQNDFFSLVQEILADTHRKSRAIVLCTNSLDENPLPNEIQFVKGIIHSDQVLEKANVPAANSVIIHGKNDQENILATLAVFNVNKKAHIVTYIENSENVKHIKRIDPNTSVVNPDFVPLIVQEMQDRGTLNVINELLRNDAGNEIYRVDIPAIDQQWKFRQLYIEFKDKYHATIIGVKNEKLVLNPNPDLEISGGTSLFIIAIDRPHQIDWRKIE